jgi:CRP-like cAMP-binding protein
MQNHHPSALKPFLDKLEHRSNLRQEEREALLELPFTTVQIASNRDFVHQGQELHSSIFVLEGMVGAFKQNRRGYRQIVAVFIRGDMVDLNSVPVPEAASNLQTLVTTTILQVPHAALRDLAIRYPNLAFAFWRESVIDASILMEWVMNVGQRDARGRMAHFLCEIGYRNVRSLPADGTEIPYPITQFALGDILGLTPVHINRTLQKLRAERLIETVDRSIQRIVDWDRLAKAGDFTPDYLQFDRRLPLAA